MKYRIHRMSSEEDIYGVHKLFEGEKSIEEIKWVFKK